MPLREFDSVKVGDQLPEKIYPLTRQDLVNYAGVSGDLNPIHWDDEIAKVSVVGVGMRSHAGIAKTMFQLLASENINIQLISTSEIKVSCVIARKYAELAVQALHEGRIRLHRHPARCGRLCRRTRAGTFGRGDDDSLPTQSRLAEARHRRSHGVLGRRRGA